jgi:hypothetical protein
MNEIKTNSTLMNNPDFYCLTLKVKWITVKQKEAVV